MTDVFWQLSTLYVAVAIWSVGFGLLFASPMGARRVARFFFLVPLQHLRRTVGEWMRQLLAYLWYLVITYALAPIGRRILRALRWFVTRERGWLRRRS